MRLLVVEDDSYYAQLISECLQDSGLTVDVAGSVEAALECRLEEFAAFIIDLMLPNDPARSGIPMEESRAGFQSGLALAKRIRQRHPTARIVLLTGAMDIVAAEDWADSRDIPFVRKADGREAMLAALERLGVAASSRTPKALIIHGRDEKMLAELKAYITDTLQWREPVVLRERPSGGKTIIEKFEEHAFRVDCAFVLLTPDDVVVEAGDNDSKRRSRQNVIFELGFCYAQWGRRSGRVIVLHKGPVEIPSDLQGIVWIDIRDGIRAADAAIRSEVAKFAQCGRRRAAEAEPSAV